MRSTMSQKIGFGLSILLAALFFMSASMKFMDWQGKAEQFERMGLTIELAKKIGIVEVVITLLFLVPRTSFLAAIMLTAYLGGAVVTHLRVGDPIFAPILIGVVVWIAEGLRNPEVFKLAFGGNCCHIPAPAAATPAAES